MQFDPFSIVSSITSVAFLGVVLKIYSNNGKVQVAQSKKDKNLYDYINKKADEGNKDHVHKDVYKSDPEMAKAIAELSRLKYGRDRAVIENEVMERSKIGTKRDIISEAKKDLGEFDEDLFE